MNKVNNAVIMAAGTSSRFAPLSFEKPKALIEVKGEVLIERQIRQLKEAGVPEIFLVIGYKEEQFYYLKEKFGVKLLHNPDYLTRNNHASIYAAKNLIRNTYICSSDNYFSINPFENTVESSYYAALYADGHTDEWCMAEDGNGDICDVKIGGENAWYMMGHAFWSEAFSREFLRILEQEYNAPETRNLLWESIFANHLTELKMKIRKYQASDIFEFDTLDELRDFDKSYISDTRSEILKQIAEEMHCKESDIVRIQAYKLRDNSAEGFRFWVGENEFEYGYEDKIIKTIS